MSIADIARDRLDKEYRIEPWGTVRIPLTRGTVVPIRTEALHADQFEAMRYWSEKLLSYRRGGYRVRITKDAVAVHKNNGLPSEDRIPFSEFRKAEIWECLVHANGYLQRAPECEATCERWKSEVLPALDAALRGEKPAYVDESPFINVGEGYAGQHLVLLTFGFGPDMTFEVYTKEGDDVPFTVASPLSTGRWK